MGSLCTSCGFAGHGDTPCKDPLIELGKNEAPPVNPKAGLDSWTSIYSRKPKKQLQDEKKEAPEGSGQAQPAPLVPENPSYV